MYDEPWWPEGMTQEMVDSQLIAECEAREVAYRAELAAEPDAWRVQAKLAQSLLESNASRIIPLPARLEEGRQLAEKALNGSVTDVSVGWAAGSAT